MRITHPSRCQQTVRTSRCSSLARNHLKTVTWRQQFNIQKCTGTTTSSTWVSLKTMPQDRSSHNQKPYTILNSSSYLPTRYLLKAGFNNSHHRLLAASKWSTTRWLVVCSTSLQTLSAAPTSIQILSSTTKRPRARQTGLLEVAKIAQSKRNTNWLRQHKPSNIWSLRDNCSTTRSMATIQPLHLYRRLSQALCTNSMDRHLTWTTTKTSWCPSSSSLNTITSKITRSTRSITQT